MDPLRASDAEREEVADFLRERCLEGRLETDELDDRLSAALSARTRGELVALVADQPGGDRVLRPGAVSMRGPARPARRARSLAVPALTVTTLLLVLVPLLLPPELVLIGLVLVFVLAVVGFSLLVSVAPFLAAGAGAVWAVKRLARDDREPPGELPPPQ